MMRRGWLVLGVLISVLIKPSIGSAVEAAVTVSKGATCRETKFPPEYATEQFEWRCPGPFGFSVGYFDHMTRGAIFFERGGKMMTDESLSWRPADPAIGNHVEWRTEDGAPIAAIFGRWRTLDEQGASAEAVVEELLVVKVSPRQICAVAVVGGLSPQSMTVARQQADTRARGFRCGIDKPFIKTSSSAEVASLDGRLLKTEFFDHNGSTVELSRSRSGAVEIKYIAPKPSLSIRPGTLLFRGSEHNGRVTGQAFVFKDGCQPAGYEVTGVRQAGSLLLEGSAPRRGSGCTLAGLSTKSGHSRLMFQRDPVLNVITAEPPLAETTQALPLERGYYVTAETPCKQASNATISLFDGHSFGQAHEECKRPQIQMTSANSYAITETCKTTQVEHGEWSTFSTTLVVKSRTAFVTTTPGGSFNYRYCKQSDLPDLWSGQDIKSLFDLAARGVGDHVTADSPR